MSTWRLKGNADASRGFSKLQGKYFILTGCESKRPLAPTAQLGSLEVYRIVDRNDISSAETVILQLMTLSWTAPLVLKWGMDVLM